jgi:hypothetical protein
VRHRRKLGVNHAIALSIEKTASFPTTSEVLCIIRNSLRHNQPLVLVADNHGSFAPVFQNRQAIDCHSSCGGRLTSRVYQIRGHFFSFAHYHLWLKVDSSGLGDSNGFVFDRVLKPQPSTDPNDPLVNPLWPTLTL